MLYPYFPIMAIAPSDWSFAAATSLAATAVLLDRAVKEYGVSLRKLEKLTGIDDTQLYRMRKGTSRYNAERAALIRDTLRLLIPDSDLFD